MWRVERRARVFVALGCTDMRKSIDGLATLVNEELGGKLLAGDLFAFCNRRRSMVKILYYDRNGFCIWMKRLVKHRFKWPENDGDVAEIKKHELAWLLDGLDIGQAHEKLTYEVVF